MNTQTLSIAAARRVALAAQGFGGRRPSASMRGVTAVANTLNVLQIDSVNVLVRSHYLPLFSRLGVYDAQLLDRAAYGKPRRLLEYWAHEASFVPMELQPYLRWRMADAHQSAWGGMRRISIERPELVADVKARIAEQGPMSAGDLEHEHDKKRSGPWWGWRDTKRATEWLFWSGELSTAHRRGFERVYDLTENIVPERILNQATPTPAEAHRELIRRAARAMGVATEADLRDYFRLSAAQSKPAVHDLVEAGELLPVEVQGWRGPSYLHRDVTVPRKVHASTLLSPFDSLVWHRPRTERLWDFRYRLEIYTPAPRRIHGYYVLPFLHGDQLVARVDLKADRKAGVLRALGAFGQDNHQVDVSALCAGLTSMASWLNMSEVHIGARGDLASALRHELRGA
ncbi:MAG: winged helix-turn-helix domain-containing protein [Corynebacteriales bacterium]|nr:winged helix-turn-helix domain-containing protein [Mycobacteriales bacterium]